MKPLKKSNHLLKIKNFMKNANRYGILKVIKLRLLHN